MNVRNMEGYVHSWMLVTRLKPIDEDESIRDFRDIPLDREHGGVKYFINCMKDYGCTEDDLEKRWMTLAKWNFMEY